MKPVAIPRPAIRIALAVLLGTAATLSSTFVGERRATAVYPDIMGCENGCSVVATGWPFIFVRDYLGMSVGNRADIFDVWLGADQFDEVPFGCNVAVWTLLFWLLLKARGGPGAKG